MAEAVVAAAEWVATALGTEMTVTATQMMWMAKGAVVLGGMAYGASAKRRAQRKAREQHNASLEAKAATNISADLPIRYVYGIDRVGANIVGMFTTGAKDEYKHLVCVFANHECTDIEEIYLNGKPVGTLDGSGNATANGDSDEVIFRGNLQTYRLPDSYGNLVVQYSTDGISYTTASPGAGAMQYQVSSAYVITLGATLATSTYYIKVTFSPNSFYKTVKNYGQQDFTTTSTALPATYGNLQVYAFSDVQTQDLISLGTDYTVTGGVITVTGTFASTPCRATYTYDTGTSYVTVKKHLGTAGEAADSYLMGLVPDKWTANHVLRGHCYCVITLNLNLSELQGGPPSIEARIKGKKLYDPRTTTTAYSTNPALVALDYILSPMVGVTLASIPADSIASINASANDCDDLITISGSSQARYTFNGTVSADEAAREVLDNMASSMAGSLNALDWFMYAGEYKATVLDLNHIDDVVGGLGIVPGYSRSEVFNTVKGQYRSAETKWVAKDFASYVDSVYRTADGEDLVKDLTFPYTNTQQRIHNLSSIFMEDNRNGLTITADFSYKAWKLRPGDRVRFTSPSTLLSMTNKVFRVTNKSFKFGDPVKITMKEDDATIWDSAPAVTVDATLNSTMPSPYRLNKVQNLAAASGDAHLVIDTSGSITSRIYVTWDAVPYTPGAYVQLRYCSTDEYDANPANWTSVNVSASETGAYIAPVSDGDVYTIMAHLYNPALGLYSLPVFTIHQVQGKLAPPTNVDSFSVSIDTASQRIFTFGYTAALKPLDYAGVEIRYILGDTASPTWSSMTPLHTGIITDSPYRTNTLYPGIYTFAIKAVDTTGNYSTTPVVVSGVDIPRTAEGTTIVEADTSYGWGGWFTVEGDRIGSSIFAETASWATACGTTWGTSTWSRNQTGTQVIVNRTFMFYSPVNVRVGMTTIFDGQATYYYNYQNSSSSWVGSAVLTPETNIYSNVIQVTIVIDQSAGVTTPALHAANIRLVGDLRTEAFTNVNPATTAGLGVVNGVVQLLGTTISYMHSVDVVVNDPGVWEIIVAPRRNSSVPELAPTITCKLNGIITAPTSMSIVIRGVGNAELNGALVW